MYVLDGVENRIKELRKFPSLTFDLNYIEQTEIDQLAQQIETTMQSDLKAKDQLLKRLEIIHYVMLIWKISSKGVIGNTKVK